MGCQDVLFQLNLTSCHGAAVMVLQQCVCWNSLLRVQLLGVVVLGCSGSLCLLDHGPPPPSWLWLCRQRLESRDCLSGAVPPCSDADLC